MSPDLGCRLVGTQQSLEVHFIFILRFVADSCITQMEDLKKIVSPTTSPPDRDSPFS
jgi:hypothetical protein